ADEQATSEQAIEGRTGTRSSRHAFTRVERVDVVAANERRVPDVEREEALVLSAAAVPPVMHDAACKRVERYRHYIFAIVRQHAGIADAAKRWRRLDTISLTLHGTRRT